MSTKQNGFLEYTAEAVVVGAGHAGCEAALALARTGIKTALLTLNLDSIAFLPCNPSIGGTAKGHLVREIDALGGEMGIVADKTALQIRMLNVGKGAAVQSLRAQSDKHAYHAEMKRVLENTENLRIIQAEASEILVEDGKCTGVKTSYGGIISCQAVILCTGGTARWWRSPSRSSMRTASPSSPSTNCRRPLLPPGSARWSNLSTRARTAAMQRML